MSIDYFEQHVVAAALRWRRCDLRHAAVTLGINDEDPGSVADSLHESASGLRLAIDSYKEAMKLAEATEENEEGVSMTPIPEFCPDFSCRNRFAESSRRLELRNGFMVCPLCLASYGEPATNPDGGGE